MLPAVDGGQRIIRADRTARTSLLLDEYRLRNGISLCALFDRDPILFRRRDAGDFTAQLIVAGTDEKLARARDPAWIRLLPGGSGGHTPLARGGLPPGAMRRVPEHVELHLSESMDLAELAGGAGFSVYHFARAFKQSTRVAPHHNLVQRRIERAREMLARSELPLSEIALAAGFSDQSHLARLFRQMLGITPGQFRRAQR